MNEHPQTNEVFTFIEDQLDGLWTDNRIRILFGVALLVFALLVNSSWNASPDSALYLSLAESILEGGGYVFNGEPHTYVPPGFPLLLAAWGKIFGSSFWSYRIFAAGFGFLASVAAFLLLLRLCGPNTAFLMGGLFSLNYCVVKNSTLILADVPFAFFVFIALIVILWASERRSMHSAVLAGLVSGLPVLVRINGLGLPAAGIVFLFFSGFDIRERIGRTLSYFAAAIVPLLIWQVWKASFPPSAAEGTYFNAIINRSIADQAMIILSAFWNYFPEMNLALSGLEIRTHVFELILPLITGLGVFLAWKKGERLLTSLVVIQFMGLMLSTAGERYLICLLPALYLFLAAGLAGLHVFLDRRGYTVPSFKNLLTGVFLAMTITNVIHDAVPIWQARNPIYPNGPESFRSEPFFKASDWLKKNDPSQTVMTTHSRVIHYLSGCLTVPLVRSGVPEHETWIDDSARIKTLIMRYRPKYVFYDGKDARLYDQVFTAVKDAGMKPEEILGASSPPRYILFKIR
jgi:hypothetical protein